MDKENKEPVKFKLEDKEYIIAKPSVSVLREAKFKYNKAFTNAIASGFYTRKNLELILKSKEVNIIEDYNKRRDDLFKDALQVQLKISKSDDPNELDQLGMDLQYIRQAMVADNSYMDNLFSNCAEQIADDERLDYLTFKLVRNSDNTPIWNSIEEFLEDDRFEFVEHCKFQVICWTYKINPEDNEKEPSQEAFDKADKIRQKKLEEQELEKEKTTKDKETKKTVKNKSKEEKAKPPKKRIYKKKATATEQQ